MGLKPTFRGSDDERLLVGAHGVFQVRGDEDITARRITLGDLFIWVRPNRQQQRA